LSEVKAGRVPQTLWTYDEVGHTQEAKKELMAAVGFPNSDVVFDTPKPTRLIRRILQLSTSPESPDLVMDFFAGTGTTMDAVFAQNAEDGGKRRCILVQLPEPLVGAEDAGWTSIADITRARIKGAGARHKAGGAPFDGDVGFRTFRLDTSNISAWEPRQNDLAKSLFDHLDHVVSGRSNEDLLYELLLKLGLDLCVPTQARQIAGKVVHSVGGGVLLTCFDQSISVADSEPLALGILAWQKELATAGEVTCVFLDSAFENDVAKTNLAAILEQHGIAKVRSL
jgi:adenine-specific DNA-methyltransferase